MPVKAGHSTPLLHVADVERSLRFYSSLGFETIDIDRDGNGTIVWARMHCEGGALMLIPAEEIQTKPRDRFLLYLYTPDLPAFIKQLGTEGIEAGKISHPDYMPAGEISLTDPDGYRILVGHWGEKEHSAWLENIETKRKKGIIA